MFDFRRLFSRERHASLRPPALDADTGGLPAADRDSGLEAEYHALIAHELRRMGISRDCLSFEVRCVGQTPQGFDLLAAMVRLHHWDRASALRLLVGLPMLEARLRRRVRRTWLADYSHFGGLWVHAAEQLHQQPGAGELRELLLALAPPSSLRRPGDPAPQSPP